MTEGPIDDSLQRWAITQFEYIAYILNSEQVDLLAKGQQIHLDKYHVLATVKQFRYNTFSRQEFGTFKNQMMESKVFGSADQLDAANELLASTAKELNQNQTIKIRIQAGAGKTFPPNVIGRKLIRQTTHINYQVALEEDWIGVEEFSLVASNNTLLYSRGKLLDIISYANEQDIQWARTESLGLVQSILEENLLSSALSGFLACE